MSYATNKLETYNCTVFTEHIGKVCSVNVARAYPSTLSDGEVVNGKTSKDCIACIKFKSIVCDKVLSSSACKSYWNCAVLALEDCIVNSYAESSLTISVVNILS